MKPIILCFLMIPYFSFCNKYKQLLSRKIVQPFNEMMRKVEEDIESLKIQLSF